MKGMADASVDAVITDPPFGIGFEYASGYEQHRTPDAYWAWLSPRYSEMLRVVRPGGFVAVWQTALYARHFWDWFGDDIHIYAAAKNFVQLRKTPINYGWDPVVMQYKSGAVALRPEKPKRSIDFFVANVAATVSKPHLRPAHPCPRPLDQTREIVANFSLPGGIVLDPFAGSGTTGLACVETGRSFIGIESDDTYAALATTRINAAVAA